MAANLKQIVESEVGSGEFRPYCITNEEADALTAYFKNDADYSERLTDHVTLYRSIDTGEIVGCRIKGISGILEDLPNYLHVNHQGATLSMIFWSFRGGVGAQFREAFNQLAVAAGEMRLQTA